MAQKKRPAFSEAKAKLMLDRAERERGADYTSEQREGLEALLTCPFYWPGDAEQEH